jgi:hypothetical protein
MIERNSTGRIVILIPTMSLRILKEQWRNLPIVNKKLSFEEWYEINETKIQIELAENGADRELDFDSEKEFDLRYQKYLEEK